MDSTTTITLLHIRHLGLAPTTQAYGVRHRGVPHRTLYDAGIARVVGRGTLQLTLRFRSRARTR